MAGAIDSCGRLDADHIFDATNLHAPQHTATVGKNPMGMAFSADGKTCSSPTTATVTVIDLVKKTAVSTFQAGTGIETLTYY